MTDQARSGLPPARWYHRWPLRLANSLLRATSLVGVGRAGLGADELCATAQRETGLKEFGDPRFFAPMQRLVCSLEQEAGLNPLGRYLARLSILRILKHRLWAEELFQRHPEILQRELPPPVVIVGLARSGTTRLHRLLAADTNWLHLKAWETVNPVPWPASFEARLRGRAEPRIANIEGALKAVLYMGPQIAAVHPLGALEVEEEIGLIQHAFSSQLFEVMSPIPDFADYLASHDQTYAYEYMVRLLKLVSWWRGDDPAASWVLKSPQHMQDLDALLRVFPDARLVFPHRDPLKVVGSCCSMAWNALVRDTDELDPHWVGSDWLDKIERMLLKTEGIRASLPAQQQLDLYYQNIGRDWRGQMQAVYQFLGVELSADAMSAMQVWVDQNRQHQQGSHKYELGDFGLCADQVESRLGWYRRRYAIPREEGNPNA